MPIVTLTSDFGTADPYAAAMKGVILSIVPSAWIVDISHTIEPRDVAHGAYVLSGSCRFFPDSTVHVGVVDPGVGSARRGIIVQADGQTFVGPDNGLFTPFLIDDGSTRIVEIENSDLMFSEVSSTFHGRDVFSPCAAHLANGVSIGEFGPEVQDPVLLDSWSVTESGNAIEGYIVHVDRFGNCITSFSRGRVEEITGGRDFEVRAGSFRGEGVLETYADAAEGASLAYYGSLGDLEIAVRNGSASTEFELKRGDKVSVVRVGDG